MKTFLNFLLCLTHLAFVVLFESVLAVTIIWFSDYRYYLNAGIVICVLLLLRIHNFSLEQLQKQNLLYRWVLWGLLFFDGLVCLAVCLIWIGFCIYLKTMPYIQIIFVIAMNIVIVRSNIAAGRNLRKVS